VYTAAAFMGPRSVRTSVGHFVFVCVGHDWCVYAVLTVFVSLHSSLVDRECVLGGLRARKSLSVSGGLFPVFKRSFSSQRRVFPCSCASRHVRSPGPERPWERP